MKNEIEKWTIRTKDGKVVAEVDNYMEYLKCNPKTLVVAVLLAIKEIIIYS